MVFYRVTFTFGQKPWKAKKWHNKFPHFSISEAAVTSTIIIMTRTKGDIWSHEYEKAAKILKTISTHKVDDADPIYWEFSFFLSGHHFNFHFQYSTSCGNRPGNSSLLLPNKEEPNKENVDYKSFCQWDLEWKGCVIEFNETYRKTSAATPICKWQSMALEIFLDIKMS